MKKIILFILCFSLLFSCGERKKKHNKKEKFVKVHVFRVVNSVDANKDGITNNDFVWYYIIYNNNAANYNYIVSSTPLNSFENLSWSSSNGASVPLGQEETLMVQSFDELSTEIQSNINTDQVSEVDVSVDNDSNTSGDSNGDSSGDSGGDSGGDGGGDGGAD